MGKVSREGKEREENGIAKLKRERVDCSARKRKEKVIMMKEKREESAP